MRKQSIFILLMSTLLVLASCAPNKKEEIVKNKDEVAEQEFSIVPSYQLSEDDYKMLLPFRPSEARGVIGNQVVNRVDIDEMEDGLRRHSTDEFDPKKYYFEEGQYLDEDMVLSWIDDLNPKIKKGAKEDKYRKNPRYLSHVLEQNFLERTDDNAVELVGVSIGLALKSVYKFQTEPGGTDYYQKIPDKDIKKQGEKLAQKILEEMREIEELQDVPIMFALYREEEQASPVPGNFISKTTVPANDTAIGEWKSVKEEYILFPSGEATKKYFDDYEIVSSFGKDISEYFPNYVGYIGEGFYMDGELKKLSIEIPIEFFGSAEVVGFTQYTYGVVKKMFPNYYDLEITIKSSDKMESLIYWEAGTEDPTVHIFH